MEAGSTNQTSDDGRMLLQNFTVETTTMDPYMNPCSEPDHYKITERFWLCVVAGISVSTVSIVFNTFIFFVFVGNKQHRRSPNLYLLFLSLFDVFIAFAYIAVMSVRVLINFTSSVFLKSIWVHYMIPMLTVSHIGITSSTFLICFASIERYCITVNNFLVPHLQKHRPILTFIAIMCGVISKGTIVKEVDIQLNPECSGELNYWKVIPSELVMNHPHFNQYWRFYFRNIFTVLAPFFILFFVNCLLLYRLQEHVKKSKFGDQDKQNVKEKKARIRATTKSVVIIVCTYLMSNLLSVVITIWEYIDSASIFSPDWIAFYVLSVDVISISTIIASSARLPIYAYFQPLLRREMHRCLDNWCCCISSKQKKLSLLDELQVPRTQLISTPDGESPSITSKIEFV
uniref:G_PROTEIN_RECEP_F1_2 domain-containing protein n=3 Tax=Caenorhabditis japonica TaxID=281687 RepID=A0A8R1HID1_CAEJA